MPPPPADSLSSKPKSTRPFLSIPSRLETPGLRPRPIAGALIFNFRHSFRPFFIRLGHIRSSDLRRIVLISGFIKLERI